MIREFFACPGAFFWLREHVEDAITGPSKLGRQTVRHINNLFWLTNMESGRWVG